MSTNGTALKMTALIATIGILCVGMATVQSDTDAKPVAKTSVGIMERTSAVPHSSLESLCVVNVAEEYHLDKTGKTDNYAKLRAWADDVNERGGGSYYFPRGNYFIDQFKTINPDTEEAVTETQKYDKRTNSYLEEKIKIENIEFKNCDGLQIIGDQAKLSVTGKFHRKANHQMGGMNYSTIWHLTPLSFINSRNIHVKGFDIDGNNQDTSRDEKVMEWQGHGLIFSGCEHFKLEDITVQGFTVDGIFVCGSLNLETKKDKICRFMEFNNVRCLRNGRQGFSMVGGAYGTFNNCEFADTGKTGKYGSHAPAAGMDIEPHHSPLGDNSGDMKYTSDEFSGFMTFNNCKFYNNAGGALYVTSTMLTKAVRFNNCMMEVDPDANMEHIFIATSCESTEFNQCFIKARTPKGVDASIYLYVKGIAQEKTGVIAGKVVNVNTLYNSCSIEGGKIWTNENNDADPGQLGLHNFKFVDTQFNDTHFLWTTRRRMLFDNVRLYYSADTKNKQNVIQNATIRDSLFKADSKVTVELGTGGNQSVFSNLGVQSNVSLGNSKRYNDYTNIAEGIEFYSYSPQLEHIRGRDPSAENTVGEDRKTR